MEDQRGRRGYEGEGGITDNVTEKDIFQCAHAIRGSACNIQLSGVRAGHTRARSPRLSRAALVGDAHHRRRARRAK